MKTIRSLATAGATACVMMLASAAAHAAFVPQWNYEATLGFDPTSAVFTPSTFGPGSPGYSYWNQTNGARASASRTDVNWGSSIYADSTLHITSPSVSGTATTGNSAATAQTVTTNLFEHHNATILASAPDLREIDLIYNLTLQDPNNPGGRIALDPFTFHVYFIETLQIVNNRPVPCAAGSASQCDDIFVIDVSGFNHDFNYEGNTYHLSASTDGFLPLTEEQCSQATRGTSTQCIGFATPELRNSTAFFNFNIWSDHASTPEPGILALLGIGSIACFAGFSLMRRRRQA